MSLDDQIPEGYKEDLLKTTALSFSLEGLSKDLEVYTQKKITFNNRNLKYISDIINSLSTFDKDVQKKMIIGYSSRKDAPVIEMLKDAIIEMREINKHLSVIIDGIMYKEEAISAEIDEITQPTSKKSIRKKSN